MAELTPRVDMHTCRYSDRAVEVPRGSSAVFYGTSAPVSEPRWLVLTATQGDEIVRLLVLSPRLHVLTVLMRGEAVR